MENFEPFESDLDGEYFNTQLILYVDAQAERQFLSRVNVQNAREEQVGALVEQYIATHIETLCFEGTDKKALTIWAERCRARGITPMLRVDAQKEQIETAFHENLTSGIVLDCREVTSFSVISEAARLREALAPEAVLYVLLSADINAVKAQTELSCMDAVIVCSTENVCDGNLPVADWLSENTDIAVFAGVKATLCERQEKKWYVTERIMNGFAVGYLSQGCNGLWLDGFCADLFSPDPFLYDIYETCGKLEECVGARRRHLLTGTYPKAVLPGADYRCDMTVGPVFEGAPVCVIVGIADAKSKDCIAVRINARECEYSGEPCLIARDEKGKSYENRFLGNNVLLAEFFAGQLETEDTLHICIHNNTDTCLQIAWVEATVNI